MKRAIRYLTIIVLSCMALAACNNETEEPQQSGEKLKLLKVLTKKNHLKRLSQTKIKGN